MGLPLVNSCCCGCSLRFGASVIGFLYGIAALSSTISLSLYAQDLNPYYNDNYTTDYTSAIIQAILSAIMLLTCVYLVIGAMQNKASYVRPWIAINGVILAIEAVMYAVVFILLLVYGAPIGFVLGYIAGYVIGLGIAFYFLVVVNSYHLSLVSQNVIFHTEAGRQQPPTHPYPPPPPYSHTQVHVVPVQVGQPAFANPTYANPTYANPTYAPAAVAATSSQVTVQGIVVVQEEQLPYGPK